MKPVICLAIILMPLIGSAADWDLFPLNQKMWFRNNNSSNQTDLFLIDSVSSEGDTTFYYPRTTCVVNGAENCGAIHYSEFNCEQNWYHSNMGAFTALSERNDTVFFHQISSGNFYFLPKIQPGGSWVINYNSPGYTCTQITITCESIEQGEVLGMSDMIKTYSLQANGSLPGNCNIDSLHFRLSQHYGFIEFVPYKLLLGDNFSGTTPYSVSLIGIESENLQTGYTLPSLTDLFHLSAGDIRMWEVLNDLSLPYIPYKEFYLDSIKTVYLSPDSIAYTFRRVIKREDSTTIQVIDNYNECYTMAEWKYMINVPPAGFEAMTDITGMDSFKDIVEKKQFSVSPDDSVTSFYLSFLYNVVLLGTCEMSWMSDGSWGKTFDTRLGLKSWWQGIHSAIYAHMIGYRIGETQWGSIWLNTPVLENRAGTIQISPNPVGDELIIVIPEKSPAMKHLTITSLNGTRVLCGELQGNHINVSGLKPGCYLLTIQTDRNVYRGKFIRK